MAGINNIIGAYNLNPKRISSKLSFEIGQIFSAKVVSLDDLDKELILRLRDGWQFPAKLQKPLDYVPNGLVKFQVEGFQDGKLQLKLAGSKKEKEASNKNSLKALLAEGNFGVDEEDYEVLRKMLSHNMPLTKENITKIKTLTDFKEGISKDSSREEKFIESYLQSKGIDVKSEEGKIIQRTLKSFFTELKNISIDELLSMMENNIDLTEENIKSFLKIFKEDGAIYKKIIRLGSNNSQENIIDNVFIMDNNFENAVKKEIAFKTEQMKNIIKLLMNEKTKLQDNLSDINDFKIFNTISSKYYYMDIPMNIVESQYNFKLIIKDDRNTGKKIDSRNVSMVISLKTNNIGVVDAYIKIKDKNMYLNFKAEKPWIKLLDAGKNSILKELSELGYNTFISIDEKVIEANLINCREFFEDNGLESINIRV